MHRVLVTAVGGNVGQGVVKALRAAARPYFIVGTDLEPRSAGFSFVDRAVVTPSAREPERLLPQLVRLISAERIEALFVCSPRELAFFAGVGPGIEAQTGARVLINPSEVVRIGSDKLETARFLERRGLPFPITATASDHAAVAALVGRCGFPLIAKPRLGFSSLNVLRIESAAALAAATVLVPDLVVQQYLPDECGEFTAGVVGSSAQRAFASIVLRRDLLQGTTYRTELVEDRGVTASIVAMAEALGVEGTCNFQFRIAGGEPVVFEINPRFSGTSGIRFRYGFNDPDMLFEQRCLGLPVRQPTLQPGVVLRYWDEVHLPGASFSSLHDGVPR